MAIGFDAARHFVSRTGLGTPPAEVARFARLTRAQAVDALVAGVRTKPKTALPQWATEPVRSRDVLMAMEGGRKDVQELLRRRGLELKGWWLREMVVSTSPFTERMTLFWHNHFTSSLRKVRRPKLLANQNLMLRRHALGDFQAFCGEMLRDPAMLVYLDNIRNHATNPNENLARELLELFTLGEGHYGEHDVKEAARALTGAGVSLRTGEYRFAKWHHDTGEKRVLGVSGPFGIDELVATILGQARWAAHIGDKLWSEFVTTSPSTSDRKLLTKTLLESRRIEDAVRVILKSDAFWDAANVATRIKSPVELVVGTLRTLEFETPNDRVMVNAVRALGQDLFDPPNVKGWPGGERWISSNTLLRRLQLMDQASRLPSSMSAPEEWAADVWPEAQPRDRVRRILLPQAPTSEPGSGSWRAYVRELMTDATYQLG